MIKEELVNCGQSCEDDNLDVAYFFGYHEGKRNAEFTIRTKLAYKANELKNAIKDINDIDELKLLLVDALTQCIEDDEPCYN